jgi:hypothetical protein
MLPSKPASRCRTRAGAMAALPSACLLITKAAAEEKRRKSGSGLRGRGALCRISAQTPGLLYISAPGRRAAS